LFLGKPLLLALFFLSAILLLLLLLNLLLGFVVLTKNFTQTGVEKLLDFFIISEVEFIKSALSCIPPLARVLLFLILFKEISHFLLNRLLAAIWVLLVKVFNDLLFAFERAMHQLDQFNQLAIDGVWVIPTSADTLLFFFKRI
jgi:hypothetical protein